MSSIILLIISYYLLICIYLLYCKKNIAYIYFLCTAPFVFLVSKYIQNTYVNVLLADGLDLVDFVGDFYAGNLKVFDFFSVRHDHLLAGYKIITLFNVHFLNWDIRLDPAIYLIASISLSALIFQAITCAQSNGCVRNSSKTALIFLPLSIVIFSLTATPGLLMATQFSVGVFLAAFIAHNIDFYFRQDRGGCFNYKLLIIFISLFAYFILFSSFYFFGLISGLFLIFLFRKFIINDLPAKKLLLILVFLLLFSSILFLLKFLSTNYYNVYEPYEFPTVGSRLLGFISSPLDILKSILAGIAGSIVDIHTFENDMNIFLYIGFVLFILTLYSLYLYKKFKIYKDTLLPLFFIGYTLGIIFSVRIGRGFSSGWEGAINEWYAIHLKPFAIGLVWILILFIINNFKIKRYKVHTIISLIGLFIIFVLISFSNMNQWNRSNNVKNWYQEKFSAMIFPEINNQNVLLNSFQVVDKSRIFLINNQLSSFSKKESDSYFGLGINPSSMRAGDWFVDNWVGAKGGLLFSSKSAAVVSGVLRMSPYIKQNKIQVLFNNKVILESSVGPNEVINFSAISSIGVNKIIITNTHSASPKLIGANNDKRFLSVHVDELKNENLSLLVDVIN